MRLLLKPHNDEVKSMYHDVATNDANDRRIVRGDAGLDLYCPDDLMIEPNDTKFINLKIQCEALSDNNDRNISYYLHCRSSIAKTPLRLANSVGIIDAGYRGNLCAVVDNVKNESFTIEQGTRLFQICSPTLEPIEFVVVNELSSSVRGTNGFGSTGV